jgi:YesN/AraC family two-component response regulator
LCNEMKNCDEQKLHILIQNAFTTLEKYQSNRMISYAITTSIESATSSLGYRPVQDVANCINTREQLLRLNDKEMRTREVMLYASKCMKLCQKKDQFTIDETIQQIEGMIEEKYDTQLSIFDIAQTLHYSPNYLGTLFKTRKNLGISEYLSMYRLFKAMNMLFGRRYSTVEIAFLCGFQNVHYFYSAFKKRTGVTPTQFRQVMNGND